jgi:hypothetical protein
VRLVVATDAQLSGETYVQLGTIVVAGAVISSITPSYAMYGTTTQLPYQVYATMSGGAATLTTANVAYDVTAYSASSVTADNIFSVNTTTGVITVRRTGLYTVSAYGSFATGTTGNRYIGVTVNGTLVQFTRAAAAGIANHAFTTTSIIEITNTDTVKIQVSSSLASQSYSIGVFTISRA